MGGMNKQKVMRAVALWGALMALGWVSAAEPQKAPPLGEQFTSQTTVKPTDGPSATQLAYENLERRKKCSHWGTDSLIQACADRAQKAELQQRQSRKP